MRHFDLLRDQHFYGGAIVARIGVCAATILWAILTMLSPHPIPSMAFGATFITAVPKPLYVASMLVTSICLLVPIFRKSEPYWLGGVGYVLMLLGWSYGTATVLLVQDAIDPLAAADCMVVAFAFYAVVANPKKNGNVRTL